MKQKQCLLIVFLLFITPVFLSAQTAAEIEALMNSKALTFGQAARFVLKAADQVGEIGEAAAFAFARDKKWLPKKAEAGATASFQGVSLLIMGSFDIKGGWFYTMTRHPHYAYRELVYREIIQGRHEPGMAVSGEQLLFIISRVLPSMPGYDDLGFDIDKYLNQGTEAGQPRPVVDAAVLREQERTAQLEALAAEINVQLEAHAVQDTTARITDQGVTISLSNIQFLANSVELPTAERRKVQDIAQILQSIPSRRILVTGHTARVGTAAEQMRTSQDRAASVAAFLVSLGARAPDEVFSQGFGAERPIADNSTPQGMALNRRVEITILEDR